MDESLFSETTGLPPSGELPPYGDAEYWLALINEKAMADFLDVSERTLQKKRQNGDGPPFVRITPSCVRYRRIDGYRYATRMMRRSTSDPGPETS